jgi:hypothetical protein
VPKDPEFAESFSKPAHLALASFQKWRALCCRLFKRKLFSGNIFGGFKNLQVGDWPVFKSPRCNAKKFVILKEQMI